MLWRLRLQRQDEVHPVVTRTAPACVVPHPIAGRVCPDSLLAHAVCNKDFNPSMRCPKFDSKTALCTESGEKTKNFKNSRNPTFVSGDSGERLSAGCCSSRWAFTPLMPNALVPAVGSM